MNSLRSAIKVSLVLVALVAVSTGYAKTPDGKTPAEESVCDPLKGGTPGLYGLCIAYCEAHDCEPDFSAQDPFSECRAGSLQVLQNYRKKMRAGDPDMPCIQGACPCWTDEQLAALRFPHPGDQVFCNKDAHVGPDESAFYDQFNFHGSSGPITYYLKVETTLTGEVGTCLLYDGCWADDDSCSSSTRFFEITTEQYAVCVDFLRRAAMERDIPCFGCGY